MRRISVITPMFNAQTFIPAAIDSVIAQNHPDTEIILVDDGSTDATVETARHKLHRDFAGRWEIIETGRNRGPSAARNTGLRAASGEWVQYLDADDLLLPGKFQRQMAAAAALPRDFVMVYSSWRRGALIDGEIEWREALPRPDVDGRDPIMCLVPPCRPLLAASLIRRSALEAAGGFDESLRFWECEALVVRVAQQGHLQQVPTSGPTYFWRMHEQRYVGTGTARYRFGPVAVGWIEQVIKAAGNRPLQELGLSANDRRLLLAECTSLARMVFRYDREGFKPYMRLLRSFTPDFCPASPAYVALPSRVVPYEFVEPLSPPPAHACTPSAKPGPGGRRRHPDPPACPPERRRVNAAVAGAMRRAARLLTDPVPVAAWNRLRPKRTIGFCYHMVTDTRLPHLKHYAPLGTQQFRADLAYVKRHFACLGYDELVRRRAAGQDQGTAILTIDDGFAECATTIAPLLRQAQLGAVFFVITDLIDNRQLFRENKAALCIERIAGLAPEQVLAVADTLGLTPHFPAPSRGRTRLDMADLGFKPDPRLRPLLLWLLGLPPGQAPLLDRLCSRLGVDTVAFLRERRPYLTTEQLRQLQAEGHTIGAHTLSHRLLQDLTLDEAEHEIVQSCRAVQAITGQASVPFAFPYTGAGFDRAWLDRLRDRHRCIGLMFSTEGVVDDAPFVVQRVFGENFEGTPSLDLALRRAWGRPAAWRRYTGRPS